jgi:transcriptional regulator with XRE-family HTH domain
MHNVFYNVQKVSFLYKIAYIMPKPATTLYPSSARALLALGQRMKDARLRRHFSAETVAARAGITRQTLAKIESGASSVTMGNYFQVLVVLGLDKDMNSVARDDVLGRRLQDAELPQRQRAPRRTSAQVKKEAASLSHDASELDPTTEIAPLNDDKKGE